MSMHVTNCMRGIGLLCATLILSDSADYTHDMVIVSELEHACSPVDGCLHSQYGWHYYVTRNEP